MQGYHSLQTFKYENPESNLTDEFHKRLDSPTTIVTNLKINPILRGIRQSKSFSLFLLPIREMLKLQDIILQNSNTVSRLTSELPPIASNQLFLKTLSDEIKSTNDIEDVKTTNAEVNDAIDSAKTNSKRNTRLKSFARMYLNIEDKKNLQIKVPEDIRRTYDYLLEGEITKDELPDGKLFRNKPVRIGTSMETVHQPKSAENEFLPDIMDWISFINDDEVPFLIKAFIAHYFFEYIHPFNDGNGRTGRYIACVYLGYKLDTLTAITFSSEINKNRPKYYKAFLEVSNPNNFGEITFFVVEMMKILIKGQKSLITSLKEKKNVMTYMQIQLQARHLDEIPEKLLNLYSQAFLFNDSGYGIEDRDLKKNTNDYPWTQVKRCILELTSEGILTKTKSSPLVRRLSHNYIDSITSSN